MKQLIIDVGKDNYSVSSKGKDEKQLPFRIIVAIMLVASVDKMITADYPKELIVEIIDETYENRLQILNKKRN